MKKKIKQERSRAVQRFFDGEEPEDLCASLGRSRSWLYKWVVRYAPNDAQWFEDQSRRPLFSPYRTPAEIEKIVEMVRLNLYNKGLFCGNQAIRWEPEDLNVQPLPSLSTIGFLAPEEFIPSLKLGIAKTHFDREKFSEAIALLEGVFKDSPKSDAAPEAVYLRGVALYKSTHNAENLKNAYERLQAEYPSSEWAKRAQPYRLL